MAERGKVKKLIPGKNAGYIERIVPAGQPQLPDIFFLFGDYPQGKTPAVGEEVEFDAVQDPGKKAPKATNIKIVAKTLPKQPAVTAPPKKPAPTAPTAPRQPAPTAAPPIQRAPQAPPPQQPVPPAIPPTATPTAHGSGHGATHASSAGGFNWWILFAFALLVVIITMIIQMPAASPKPITVQPIWVVPPSPPAVTPSPAPAVVASQPPAAEKAAERDPIRHFEVLDAVHHAYQLDAREEWRELDVIAEAGRYLRVTTDEGYKTCASLKVRCAEAEGIGDLVTDKPEFQNFASHNGTAKFYSLLGRWGSHGAVFVIGNSFSGIIPADANTLKLQVMSNVEPPANYGQWYSGGARITNITIQ